MKFKKYSPISLLKPEPDTEGTMKNGKKDIKILEKSQKFNQILLIGGCVITLGIACLGSRYLNVLNKKAETLLIDEVAQKKVELEALNSENSQLEQEEKELQLRMDMLNGMSQGISYDLAARYINSLQQEALKNIKSSKLQGEKSLEINPVSSENSQQALLETFKNKEGTVCVPPLWPNLNYCISDLREGYILEENIPFSQWNFRKQTIFLNSVQSSLDSINKPGFISFDGGTNYIAIVGYRIQDHKFTELQIYDPLNQEMPVQWVSLEEFQNLADENNTISWIVY